MILEPSRPIASRQSFDVGRLSQSVEQPIRNVRIFPIPQQLTLAEVP